MKFVAAGLTDVGRERDHNEDTFLVDDALGLFLVADGMGGHRAGEVASSIARDTIHESMRTAPEGSRIETLAEAVRSANQAVVREGQANRARKGMGTTVVAMAIDGDAMVIAHAGDSRCYRFRAGKLERLTRDHSLIEELAGDDPAVMHALAGYSNVITRALGTAADTSPDVRSEALVAGDMYILCSDGLCGPVDDVAFEQLIAQGGALAEICTRLVLEANERGGPDNITVVLVSIEA
ncbi:MAG: protein phosphatase 2C domain-containing protein [Deltaproteobacteria bacterium]|nr:protein phosphatase 2C domain-containing protein [Deltaproteobacteria bacterium]